MDRPSIDARLDQLCYRSGEHVLFRVYCKESERYQFGRNRLVWKSVPSEGRKDIKGGYVPRS